MFADQLSRSRLYLCIIAKSRQPLDLLVTPKPRHLPLRIIAVSLLRRRNRLRACHLSTQ